MSAASAPTLAAGFGAVICDLDGVLYRGPRAVRYAVPSLGALGESVHFATNNASRTPEEVVDHLRRLGLNVERGAVTTSAEAGAVEVRTRVGRGSTILVIGGAGVGVAVSEQGGTPVREYRDGVAAVLQGYGPEVRAADLAEAAYAIEGGALWVATNADKTLPTDRGIAPGNGTLVAAVAEAAGREPDVVAGKPHPPLYRLALARCGVEPGRALAIGDRLDTDIAGAHALGMSSLHVLTGVDGLKEVLFAPADRRPTWVVPDLRWLHRPGTDPTLTAVRALLTDAWTALDAGSRDPHWISDTLAALDAVARTGATVG